MLIKPVLSNVPSQYGRVSLASPVSVIVRVQEDDSGRVQHVRLASSSYFLVLLLKNFHPVVGGKKRSSSPSTTFTSAFNQERCPSSPTSHSFPDLGVDRRGNEGGGVISPVQHIVVLVSFYFSRMGLLVDWKSSLLSARNWLKLPKSTSSIVSSDTSA